MPPSTTASVLGIEYESEGFNPGCGVTNGISTLATSWDELLWAALTVGRPNRQYVFRHGNASMYEAMFRLSLVRMAVEQSGPSGRRLRRTAAARTLDPTEKGAVNYFLGMTVCKLFCARLLDAPWMLHLDVFRPQLNPVLTGRSRPDLVGQTMSDEWVALEAKGRLTPPSAGAKDSAKAQAQRLVAVNGVAPAFNVGGIMHFRNDTLRFFWRDPEPGIRNPIEVAINDIAWRYYYAPVFEFIRAHPQELDKMLRSSTLMPVAELDIELGIFPSVLERLSNADWIGAKRLCHRLDQELDKGGYQADGIRVVAGPTWLSRFAENDESGES